MAVIQYFLQGVAKGDLCDDTGKIRLQLLRDAGIAEALRDITQVPRDAALTGVQHGPGNAGGLLITPVRFDGEVGKCCYLPDEQHWIQAGERTWIGTVTTEPIKPADLQRRRIYQGYRVSDDDVEWMIPIARSDDDSRVTLPQDISFRERLAVKSLRAQYRHLWDLAGCVLDWVAGQDSPASDEQWRIVTALTAINTNYRLWRDECNLATSIGTALLSTEVVNAICMSIADVQFMVEVKKKDLEEVGQLVLRSDGSTTGIEDGAITARVGAN